jgi:hypothetical protein
MGSSFFYLLIVFCYYLFFQMILSAFVLITSISIEKASFVIIFLPRLRTLAISSPEVRPTLEKCPFPPEQGRGATAMAMGLGKN